MSEGFHGSLAYQPDIYQRYGLLAGLTQVLLDDGTGSLTVLDVGCGPVRLTETFLASRFTVVRADVSQFGDPEIVEIRPGEPLPFDAGSFDLTLGLEVIEHLPPSARPGLIRELQRVARRATIVCCPVATPETIQAEREFARWATAIAGREIEFLAEHEQHGLPDAADVISWFASPADLLVLENAPLDDWQLFNLLDFMCAADLGEGEDKRRLNAMVNAHSRFARAGVAHYRRFFAAFASPTAATAAARFADQIREAGSKDPAPQVQRYAEAILSLHESLRKRFGAELAGKQARIDQLEQHIAGLSDGVTDLRNFVAQKDEHINGLDANIRQLEQYSAGLLEGVTDLRNAIAQKDEHISALEAHLGALDEQAQTFESDIARLAAEVAEPASRPAQTSELASYLHSIIGDAETSSAAPDGADALADARHSADVLRDTLHSLRETLDSRERDIDDLRARAAAAEDQLQSVLASRSWRLTRPLRGAGHDGRRIVGAMRGVAAGRLNPRSLFTERWQRDPAYRTIAGSGLFDGAWYRARYPDVAAAKVDPLVHYLKRGAVEGRDPHPLFDARYYTSAAPLPAGTNPLLHFVTAGVREGRDPHPLFNTKAYLEENRDVASAGLNPLAHYYVNGGFEGRNPHRLFDSAFYLAHNPDVAAAKVNPLAHYLSSGAQEGRDPHPDFDTSFYLTSNPDVAAANVNPLVHFVLDGHREGRSTHARTVSQAARSYVPPHGLLPWFNPLNVEVSAPLSNEPRLNVLVPALGIRNLSGGPNTALVLAGRLAAAGIRVRLVSTDLSPDQDPEPFWAHLRHLLGGSVPPGMELVDAHYRNPPLAIGERDIFMATAWWTAQQAKYAVRHTVHQRFVYLIQDYEPLFHAASTSQALAEETYTLDHIPVINSSWLYDFLVTRRIGRFADERFSRDALVFEPAVDGRVFYPRERPDINGRRRILFYARPTGALRNLFELGVAALQKAVADGVLKADEWEFVGMGEQFAPVPLGGGAVLVPAPWLDLPGYARQMRESDLLLSLMLSPHPSYPPIEMAASGGLVVTTTYEGKSAEQLASLSTNIVATAPTLEAITAGLATVHARVPDWAGRMKAARVNLPQTWSDSLEAVVPALVTRLLELQGSPRLSPAASLSGERTLASVHPVYRAWPKHRYDIGRREALARRRDEYPALERPGLLSFLTPVWNADPRQLEELAESVLDQDLPHNYEWIVLDNGSDRIETREVLQRLAQHRGVRLYRSDENLGIIAGTRFCLERATGRYAATVDHDDLLAPDCVRVVTHALVAAGYPALAYSDEDKVDEQTFRDPYFKPDWDPVLFGASCYIAHLIVFDRQQALALDAYTDQATEGSHDWDTFMRFMLARFEPVHISEVLYTWRMHAHSTAGNIESKPYVAASHQRVLQKFVAAAARPDWYSIEASPLFAGTPDWWIRRQRVDPWPITTVLIREGDAGAAALSLDPAISHDLTIVAADAGIAALEPIVGRCADARRLVHVWWAGTEIDGSEWPWEAMAQFELFPDTAVVGGRIHWDGRIQSAASYFGFGRGCDSPDRGRAVADAGYFAQMWKPRSASAVPVQHCVVEPVFLQDFLKRYGHTHLPLRQLGPWMGAFARAQGRRVIYSPFVSARSGEDVERQIQPVEWATFRAVHRAAIPERKYLSPRLGLDPSTAYQPVTEETRRAQLDAQNLADGTQMLDADRAARRALYPAVPAATSFSLLTSVYDRTPPELLELLCDSLLRQSRPFDEWVLLVNGPVPAPVERIVTSLESDSRIKVSRVPANVGIVGAMRRCLASSGAEYVVPVDADDILEEDALEVLEAVLDRGPADFAYSDEDILSDEAALARYSRPDFDPVLNLETSYIWHLCAFRRARALDLGVYSDRGAEFCHDWDTVHRFAADGAAIVHIPHVLYRWRTHATSQSHSGVQNQGSVASTRHVLQQVVSRQPRPELYELRRFPLFRGVEEWYVARRTDAPPAIDVLILDWGPASAGGRAVESVTFPFRRVVRIPMAGGWPAALRDMAAALDGTSSHVAVVSDSVCPDGDAWVWEAIRLFELHDDVAVVSGRVHDDQDIVIDTGRRFASWSDGYKDFTGLLRTNPGPFALALKPHSIDVPGEVPMMVSTPFLLSALALAQERVPVRLAELLGRAAAEGSRRIAYSPLLEARVRLSTQP